MIDRQGYFRGDLNMLQRIGLEWLINREIKEMADIERMRIETNALASNKNTSPEFLKALFLQHEEEANLPQPQDQVIEVDDDWVTPTTPQEIEAFLNL